jgi:hypothetical protein
MMLGDVQVRQDEYIDKREDLYQDEIINEQVNI